MEFPKFLRIAVVPNPGVIYLKKNEDGEYAITGGPEGKVIEMCSQALKFSYKLLPASEWGNEKNGTMTGGIGMVYRNETDIAISKFGISELRQKYVDYSYPYSLEDLIFVIQKPGLRSPIDSIIHPFSSTLWLGVAITLIFMSMSFSLFRNISFTKSMQDVFGILVSQSAKTVNLNMKDKFIVASWLLGSMILSHCYQALLLAFLTVPLREEGVENLEELSAAVAAGTHKAMAYRGAMQLADLQTSEREVVKIIVKHIESNDNLLPFNRAVTVDTMRKGNVAVIGPGDTLQYLVESNVFMSQDSIKPHRTGIVISKFFCCKDKLDSFVHTLSASGIYNKLVRDAIFMANLKAKASEIDDSPDEPEGKSLSMSDMSGPFILIATGHTMAIIVFMGELIYFKIHPGERKEDKKIIKRMKNFQSHLIF